MKKLALILLSLVLLLTCALSASAAFDPVGTWKFTNAEYNGIIIDASTMGVNMRFQLFENGTMTADLDGAPAKGTWELTEEGLLIKDGIDPQLFIVADDYFYIEKNGVKMNLTRVDGEAVSTPETEVIPVPEEIPASDYTGEFDPTGAWEFARAEFADTTILPSEMGLAWTVDFSADGTVWMDFNGEAETVNWKMADGAIVANDGHVDMIFTIEGDGFYYEQEGVKMIFDRKAE